MVELVSQLIKLKRDLAAREKKSEKIHVSFTVADRTATKAATAAARRSSLAAIESGMMHFMTRSPQKTRARSETAPAFASDASSKHLATPDSSPATPEAESDYPLEYAPSAASRSLREAFIQVPGPAQADEEPDQVDGANWRLRSSRASLVRMDAGLIEREIERGLSSMSNGRSFAPAPAPSARTHSACEVALVPHGTAQGARG